MKFTGVKVSESRLIPPYGGELVNVVVGREEAEDLWAEVSGLPSVQISERAMCDLELMATGGFSPLDRFMSSGMTFIRWSTKCE